MANTNSFSADVAFQKEIERRRKQTGVSPVKQGANIPARLRKKIKEAAENHGLWTKDFRSASSVWMLFQHLLLECDTLTTFKAANGDSFNVAQCKSYRSLFDHGGTTKIGNNLCFVLEPYPCAEKEEYESRLATMTYTLSRILNCDVTWTSNSWHYPDNTYRILFENF